MIHIENTTIEEQIAYEKDFAKFCLEQAEKWKNKDLDEYKYEVLGIDDVDDLPNDDYRYGMERALELIDIYKPKEGDAE